MTTSYTRRTSTPLSASSVGRVLYDHHPALVQTDDAPETVGPNAREFAHAILKLDHDNDEPSVSLQDIANYLEYPYDVVQKRAARIMKEIPIALLQMQRVGRTNHYRVFDATRLRAWLGGSAG